VIGRLLSAVEDAVETFINAVVDHLIEAWLEEKK
jgi:hypothetical protein